MSSSCCGDRDQRPGSRPFFHSTTGTSLSEEMLLAAIREMGFSLDIGDLQVWQDGRDA